MLLVAVMSFGFVQRVRRRGSLLHQALSSRHVALDLWRQCVLRAVCCELCVRARERPRVLFRYFEVLIIGPIGR